MDVALTYLWKEWRAQRGLLVAYHALVYTCLCLGLYLAPRHAWFEESFGVHALSWFVAAGVIAVVVFVVPGLVRGEFTAQKGDQFVRRLPGALWPAFWGKLLFLVLAVLLLPLLGLLVGELFVQLLGQNWNGLFYWSWDGNVQSRLPWQVLWLAAGLLLVPWIWAAGTWTPGGRLAPLAALLLVLLVAVGLYAVLRASPNLAAGVDPSSFLWLVPASGLVAAAVSWAWGRRGGGPLRSARTGLLATGVMLLPLAVWLGERSWRYHHPRSDRLAAVRLIGLDPNDRYALVGASERDGWMHVPMRVDLETGAVTQLGGIGDHFPFDGHWWRVGNEGARRFWPVWRDGEVRGVLDLQSGEVHAAKELLKERALEVAPALFAQMEAERVRFAEARAVGLPDGGRAWRDGDELVFEAPDKRRERVAWPLDRWIAYPQGHAIGWYGDTQTYDLVTRTVHCNRGSRSMVHVGGVRIVQRGQRPGWWTETSPGTFVPLPELDGYRVLGLFDDRRLLVVRTGRAREFVSPAIALFEVATRSLEPCSNAEGVERLLTRSADVLRPLDGMTAPTLPRDPAGRVWLQLDCAEGHRVVCVGDDATVRPVAHLVGRRYRLLRWREFPRVLIEDESGLVDVDVATGRRRVRFAVASSSGQLSGR